MNDYSFNYMNSFKCLGKDCKHNCCLNWHISIDKSSLKRYNNLIKKDKRFETNIDYNSKQFIKDDKGRCLFLNQDNLCEIIIAYGEKALCKTCKTHPRFVNFFKGFKESGATLSCEMAGKLIVTSKPKICLVKKGKKISRLSLVKENPNLSTFEKRLLKDRYSFIKIAQDKKLNISKRLEKILSLSKIKLTDLSFNQWVKFFSELEILDKSVLFIYDKMLKDNKNTIESKSLDFEEYSKAYENILSYLLFKNIPKAVDCVDIMLYVALSVLGVYMIANIFDSYCDKNINGLIEACRIYSSEIEYSDNNIQSILNKLESLIRFC